MVEEEEGEEEGEEEEEGRHLRQGRVVVLVGGAVDAGRRSS